MSEWRRDSGVLAVAALVGAAWVLKPALAGVGLGASAIGLLFGLLLANTVGLPAWARPGVSFAGKQILLLGVVLLGASVQFGALAELGVAAIGAAFAAVAVGLLVAVLVGRLLGVSAPLALLIGTGTGVCGASAIAAVRGLAGADDEQTTYAVAAITLLGTVGLLSFPFLFAAFPEMGAAAYGVLSGASLHAVPQAVGAAMAGAGVAAAGPAALVKLTRVAALPAVVAVLAWSNRGGARWPPEVVGFAAVVVAANILPVPAGVTDAATAAGRVALVAGLTALGWQTRLSSLRSAGVRPMALACVAWLAVLASAGAAVWVGYGFSW